MAKATKYRKALANLSGGMDRLQQEAEGIARLMRNARVPETASPEIIAAPARGPQRVLPQFETTVTENGPRARRSTLDGFHPVACIDAFDLMSQRAKGRGGEPLFTVAQVEAGRTYAALVERVEAEGVKCQDFLRARGRSDADRDWIEGVIQRSARVQRMREAIKHELIDLRAEGGDLPGRTMSLRGLVDGVCLKRQSVSQILRAYGWRPNQRAVSIVLNRLRHGLDLIYGL